MGRYGYDVIDADGHGGEPRGWRTRIPDKFKPQMREYVALMKQHYGIKLGGDLPGGGQKVGQDPDGTAAYSHDDFEFESPDTRVGMADPAPRLDDMDEEGIDITVMFPPGSGEEWALRDEAFSVALCQTLNDARADYASHAPERLKLVAKLPMISPHAAAEELERCVTTYPELFVGMVTAQHIRERNLSDPVFDVVWETAQRLDVAVCTHGGGQAPDQVPIAIDRFSTRLEIHAITHPLGAMMNVSQFIIGGMLTRFPKLRVGFMEAGVGWLPFWLERLDEHWEHMPQQAPQLDRRPSEVFLSGRCFLGMEPEDSTVANVANAVSEDVVCYASDYCHWDCAFPYSVKLIVDREDLTDAQKRKILSENPGRLYNLSVPH